MWPDSRLTGGNPRLSGVIDVTGFNATTAGQCTVDDGRLAALVQVLNHPVYRLGLDDVEPDILSQGGARLPSWDACTANTFLQTGGALP